MSDASKLRDTIDVG